MPYQPPAGFYQATNVNYPQRPSAIGGIVDEMGLPNGVGSNMMSEPYSEEEIATTAKAPLMKAPGVPLPPLQAPSGPTVLTPGRQTPFSRADAQALAALDPRSLAEAKDIAALPESTPAKMTGSFGGQSFEMQPSARVDRNVLARLYAQGMERQGEERRDAIRAQAQSGAESLARIPVQGAVDLAKQQGSDKIGAINAEGAIQAPTRAANIRKSDQEATGIAGTERRTQSLFDLSNSPAEQQRKSADDAIKTMQASGLDKTPQGRQTIAALMALSSAGSRLPDAAKASFATAASQTNPGVKFEAARGFTQDPEVQRLIASINAGKQGLLNSPKRKAQQDADIQALNSYAEQYGAAKDVDPKELLAQLSNQTVGATAGSTVNPAMSRILGDTLLPLPLRLLNQ